MEEKTASIISKKQLEWTAVIATRHDIKCTYRARPAGRSIFGVVGAETKRAAAAATDSGTGFGEGYICYSKCRSEVVAPIAKGKGDAAI